MSIDKSIRQYYSRGQLVKPGPGRPGYQGWQVDQGLANAPSSSGGVGNGEGEDRRREAAKKAMQATIAAAEKKAAAPPPRQIYEDPDPVTETVPGDVTFEPKKEIKSIGPSLHGGPTYDQDKVDIIKDIKDRQLEKMDYIPDDITQLDLNKFGEGYETVKPDLRTERETGEDWERSQDWDKVKDLSKQGYNFTEIQDAMKKGLLTKTDPRSIKTNLLSRGINNLRNLIPRTGLERKLLGGLKKSFVPTEGGPFSIKGMASNFAKKKLTTMALQKLGLGALAPWLGVASMFGFNPIESLMNKFSGKSTANKVGLQNELGLHVNRFPMDTTEQAKVGEAYRGADIPTQVAKGEGLESGAELLGLKEKDMMEDFYAKQEPWSKRIGDQLGANLQEVGYMKDLRSMTTQQLQKMNDDQISTFQSGDPNIERVLKERGISVVGEKGQGAIYNPVESKVKKAGEDYSDIFAGNWETKEDIQQSKDFMDAMGHLKHGWSGTKLGKDEATKSLIESFKTNPDYYEEKFGFGKEKNLKEAIDLGWESAQLQGQRPLMVAEGGLINLYRNGGFSG